MTLRNFAATMRLASAVFRSRSPASNLSLQSAPLRCVSLVPQYSFNERLPWSAQLATPGSMRLLSKLTKGKLVNHKIQSQDGTIRLIDSDGTNRGLQNLEKSIQEAKKHGLDLVQIAMGEASDSIPAVPICKIMSYDKVMYEQKKKEAEKRSQAKTAERQSQIKEIQIGTSIGENDVKFKLAKAREFLMKGYTFRLKIVFRRSTVITPAERHERAHEILRQTKEGLQDVGRELEDQRKVMPGSIRAMFIPQLNTHNNS